MSGRSRLKAFAHSVLAGALAAGSPTLLVTIPAVAISLIGQKLDLVRIAGGFLGIIFPFALALPIVLTCCLLIGLPVDALLRQRKIDTPEAYGIVGAMTGLLAPAVVIFSISRSSPFDISPEAYWVCLVGGLGGCATALTWWKRVIR